MENVIFGNLVGQIIAEITGLEKGNDRVVFSMNNGSQYVMYHNQDCCESVSIDDINGDTSDIIGYQILLAEERQGDRTRLYEYDESFTWTFYTIRTIKGSVDIRWYGSSNGYYSEGVDFDLLTHPAEDK